MRILVVEGERKVARAVQEGLEAESYLVALAHTGEDGFFLANSEPFDLVVLDVMLPGRTGIEVLSAMRKRGIRTPVLLLTAKDASMTVSLGSTPGLMTILLSHLLSRSCWRAFGRFFAVGRRSLLWSFGFKTCT